MKLDEVECEALGAGTFALTPLRCAITRNTTGSVPVYGAGTLQQVAGGLLHLTVNCGIDALGAFSDHGSDDGFVPVDDYSTVEMVDHKNRVWKADHVLVDYSFFAGGASTSLVRVRIPTLSSEELLPIKAPNSSLEVRVFAGLGLPPNTRTVIRTEQDGEIISEQSSHDRARLAVGEVRLEIHTGERGTRVIARSDQPLSADLEHQILNALQVVGAKYVRSGVVVETTGTCKITTIRSSGLAVSRMPRALDPVPRNYVDSAEHVWSLFRDVWQFSATNSRRSQEVLAAWDGAMRAEASSLEQQSLVRCVAIETIVRSATEDDRARKRVKVGTVLKELAATGMVDERLIRIWQKTRDDVAHGIRLDGRHARKQIRDLDAVTTLLHQVLFDAVGYRGCFTDYSTQPFTRRDYPLPTTATASPTQHPKKRTKAARPR